MKIGTWLLTVWFFQTQQSKISWFRRWVRLHLKENVLFEMSNEMNGWSSMAQKHMTYDVIWVQILCISRQFSERIEPDNWDWSFSKRKAIRHDCIYAYSCQNHCCFSGQESPRKMMWGIFSERQIKCHKMKTIPMIFLNTSMQVKRFDTRKKISKRFYSYTQIFNWSFLKCYQTKVQTNSFHWKPHDLLLHI